MVCLVPHEYPILPEFTTWPTFPFEGDLRIRPFDPPVAEEPPRQGEDPATCAACLTPDNEYLWVSARWRVRSPERPTGLPMVLILEPRSHLDLGDLPNLLAAELGVMTVRLERAVRSLDGVARVHVNRWGDGSAHLNLWFLARPVGQLQLRGTFLSLWDDILPAVPEWQWRENLAYVGAWLAEFGGRTMVEPPHIQWQSPSSVDKPDDLSGTGDVRDLADPPVPFLADTPMAPRWTAVTSESPIYVPRQRVPRSDDVASQADAPTVVLPEVAFGDLGATYDSWPTTDVSSRPGEGSEQPGALPTTTPAGTGEGQDLVVAVVGIGSASEPEESAPVPGKKAAKAAKATMPRKAAAPRKAAPPRKRAGKKAAATAPESEPTAAEAEAPKVFIAGATTSGTRPDTVGEVASTSEQQSSQWPDLTAAPLPIASEPSAPAVPSLSSEATSGGRAVHRTWTADDQARSHEDVVPEPAGAFVDTSPRSADQVPTEPASVVEARAVAGAMTQKLAVDDQMVAGTPPASTSGDSAEGV